MKAFLRTTREALILKNIPNYQDPAMEHSQTRKDNFVEAISSEEETMAQ